MKLVAGLTAFALGACASFEPQDMSPAIYLKDGVVLLPHAGSLEVCAEAVRRGAKAPDPKSLGQFIADPTPRVDAIGGCLTPEDRYYHVTETGVALSQTSDR